MIGDVNLFFNDPDNDKTFAEIEIMIAEENYRRYGYGIEAINMMMAYGVYVTCCKPHCEIELFTGNRWANSYDRIRRKDFWGKDISKEST